MRRGLRVLEEKLDILRGLLHGFDYADFLTGHPATSFPSGAGRRRQPRAGAGKDGKKRFADPRWR
jgi:type I restriction enzyme R subunit